LQAAFVRKYSKKGAMKNVKQKNDRRKIEEARAKITQYENHMKQLVQKQKAEERKARTKRLCSRHGLLESMFPETIVLTDEQFKAFLEKAVVNDYGRRMLDSVMAKSGGVTTAPKPVEVAKRVNPTSTTAKPIKATQGGAPTAPQTESSGTDGNAGKSGSAAQTS